jgi:hypothetical protein
VDDVRPIPVGWIGARSAAAAVDLFCRFAVVEASLDCDLGACDECIRTRSECAATLHCEHIPDGVALVRWMVSRNRWSATKPRVHSLNPTGGAEMRRLIEAHWKEFAAV